MNCDKRYVGDGYKTHACMHGVWGHTAALKRTIYCMAYPDPTLTFMDRYITPACSSQLIVMNISGVLTL